MEIEGGDIVLPIKLSTEDAERLWAQLKDRIEKDPPRPGVAPPPAAEKGTKSLIERLRELRAEETSNSRSARFFANELAGLVPGMTQASASLRGFTEILIEGAAGGLSFGLAFQAVKFGVAELTDYLVEADKRFEEILSRQRARADETTAVLLALGRAVDSISGRPLTKTEEAIRQATDDANKKLLEQDRILSDMKRRGDDLSWLGGGRGGGYEIETREFKRAKEERLRIEQDYADRIRSIRERGAADERQRARELLGDEAVAVELKTAGRVVQIQKQLQVDLAKLRRETPVALQDTEEFRRKVTAMERASAKEVADYRAQQVLQARQAEVSATLAIAKESGELEIALEQEFNVQRLAMAEKLRVAQAAGDAEALESLHRQIDAQTELEGVKRRALEMQKAAWIAQQSRNVNGPGREASAEEIVKANDERGAGSAEAARRLEELRNFARALKGELSETSWAFQEAMRSIDNGLAEGLLTVEQAETAKTMAVLRESQRRIAALKEESAAGLAGATAMQMTAEMIGGGFSKMATHAYAYDRAMQAAGKSQAATASEMSGAALAWTQEVLAAIAQQAAVKAIFALAEGFMLEAQTGGVPNPASVKAFAAAATYGLVGGAAAAAGYAIGEMRPMTQQERQQVEGATGGSSGTGSSGGSSTGTSSSGTRIGWRDAGVDMGDRGRTVVYQTLNVRAMDAKSFDVWYREQAPTVLKVHREWDSAGRR